MDLKLAQLSGTSDSGCSFHRTCAQVHLDNRSSKPARFCAVCTSACIMHLQLFRTLRLDPHVVGPTEVAEGFPSDIYPATCGAP